MSHVFRLSSGGVDTLDGWSESAQYNNRAISTITDPSGGVASLPITSIPSPFASLELIRGAFAFCADNVEGDSIHHKMVSQALDVLEIFFDYAKYEKYFDIITWNVKKDLEELLSSPNEDHRCLGETLSLYLHQDAKSFNFDKLTDVFLLDYREGPAHMNIVGGTSSTSLCVASNNDLCYVSDIFLSNGHRAFDPAHFTPLHKRGHEFFQYLWALSLVPEFGSTFIEVKKYIEASFVKLDDAEFKGILKTIRGDYYLSAYMPLMVNAQTLYFPGGIAIGTIVGNDISSSSDFRLNSSKSFSPQPLVLPLKAYTEPHMHYTTGFWDSHFEVPAFDPRPLSERTLPNDGSLYPYLTASDFFEPYIIHTAFPVNGSAFFNAAHDTKAGSFLLPLKKDAFRYISIDELMGLTLEPRPRKVFEIVTLAGNSVKAVLNIPVQKGKYITLERIYYDGIGNSRVECDETANKGAIINCTFDLFLFPSYHFANDALYAPQRIYLVDEDSHAVTMDYRYSVKAFADDAREVDTTFIPRADKHAGCLFSSEYFCTNRQFQYVQVSNGFAQGLLIPSYKVVHEGNKEFEFAIDFGTTNTHIEYKVGNIIKPLEVDSHDCQVLSLHNQSDTDVVNSLYEIDCQSFIEAVPEEFVPLAIGKNQTASFPLRTNICMSRTPSGVQREKVAIADHSIGFHYEKNNTYSHNECITNLKWGVDNADLIGSYFEELLLIIRNKVALNGGSIAATRIKWFFPISMARFQFSLLESTWSSICTKLFGDSCVPEGISESLAPYYYYKNSQSVNSARVPVVSMDIGGGTTDFVVYRDNKPELISSVRFAGNSIYGDFVGSDIRRNGFVAKYADSIQNAIRDCYSASALFDDMKAAENSADFVSFLYSLEKNPDLRRYGIDVSFSKILAADYDMKIVILLFFASEIYYIANLLKSKGFPAPGYITVSGTGSKILNLIGNVRELQQLARKIFFDVLGEECKVELKQVPNPKEITCKGGLGMANDDFVDNPNALKYCISGSASLDMEATKYYENVNRNIEDEVVAKYVEFIDYFFALNDELSFADFFGITGSDKFGEFKDVLTDKASEDLAALLDARRRELKSQNLNELDDSLFFFPLSGGINRLAYFISQK